MAISVGTFENNTYRLLSPLLWCSLLQGQTPMPAPAVPAAPAAPAAEHTLHVTQLPDSTTPLSSSTVSVSQPLHIRVGQTFFLVSHRIRESGHSCPGERIRVDSEGHQCPAFINSMTGKNACPTGPLPHAPFAPFSKPANILSR